jgi:nucleoside-diphosphate kinase
VATLVERSLVLVKPDGVKRALTGTIIERIERKGIRVVAMDLRSLPRELVEEHYAEHQGKPFFEGLIAFITEAPVIAGVLEGNEAIAVVRTLLGATNGVAAAPGTVRGDFSISKQNNLMHGSDSEASAQREIALWFRPEEVVAYPIAGSEWVFNGA